MVNLSYSRIRYPEAAASPVQVAEGVFNGIRENKLYILLNPELQKKFVQYTMENLLQERNPKVKGAL